MKKTDSEGLRERVRELEEQLAEHQKKQEQRLEREEFYRFLTENASDLLFIQDMDLRITYVSPSVTPLFGYTVEEAARINIKDIMTPESLDRAMESFHREVPLAYEHGDFDIPLMDYEYIRKDGSTFWGELKVRFLFNAEGSPVSTLGILRNIEKRKKAEEALRESESKFRTLFDLSPQAIALTEPKTGRLVDVNIMFCQKTFYTKEEIIGRSTTEIGFYSPGDRDRFVSTLKTCGEVHGMEMDFRARNGTILNTLMFAKEIRVSDQVFILTVFYDITEKKRLEAQLRQSQKMEAIGSLAGGVAHDFNNLLMGILGNVTLMLMDTESHQSHFSILKDIEKQVMSGAELTRQLLGYARKGKYEVKVLDLNKLVRETSVTFNRTRKQIIVRPELAPDLLAIEADRSQIEQVLLNLYLNASDAMPVGGELTLHTFNLTYEDMTGRPYIPKKGMYVCLEVTDTGTGMDRETQQRIFEPFFTTKMMGKGTGLGLASVYGIIKGHGGYINVASEPGQGTTFSIYLPASDKHPDIHEEPDLQIETSSGTILMVDDEEIILNMGSKILERLGYRVLPANSGKKALEVYEAEKDGIDLIILDMIMPGMGGGETFDRIRAIDPHAKVLLSSGYSLDGEATDILKRGCNGFIQKPFKFKDLSLRIKVILERP
jgi:PAS domain S-box-containing protein